jgi:hypothetical protein
MSYVQASYDQKCSKGVHHPFYRGTSSYPDTSSYEAYENIVKTLDVRSRHGKNCARPGSRSSAPPSARDTPRRHNRQTFSPAGLGLEASYQLIIRRREALLRLHRSRRVVKMEIDEGKKNIISSKLLCSKDANLVVQIRLFV